MCHSMHSTTAVALFQGYIILAVHTQLQQISPDILPISSYQIDSVPLVSHFYYKFLKVYILTLWC